MSAAVFPILLATAYVFGGDVFYGHPKLILGSGNFVLLPLRAHGRHGLMGRRLVIGVYVVLNVLVQLFGTRLDLLIRFSGKDSFQVIADPHRDNFVASQL